MEKRNNDFLEKIESLINSNYNKQIVELLNRITSSKIYIYGAGNAGAMTYNLLRKATIEIEGFIDRRADSFTSYMNKPVFRADDSRNESAKDKSLVIIAFLCTYQELQNVKTRLIEMGYPNVCYYHDIYNLMITQNYVNSKSKNAFKNEQQKILNIGHSLCDDKSREVYYNFFNAIMNANADLFSEPDEQKQYFINDIPFIKGYSRFIDCGAFEGDTAFALYQYKGQVDKAAFFEPDNYNFKKLRENMNSFKVANEEILFPCGVWKQTEMLRFESGAQSSSTISEDGDVFVQCVALDDVLRDFAPTFIKMDIEGAEYEALVGTEKMIKRYAPDLAISVYHKIEHMWEIPLLIKKFNPNYKLYLRCHGLHGMETILYATCE